MTSHLVNTLRTCFLMPIVYLVLLGTHFKIYQSLVGPILEYCYTTCLPNLYHKEIDKIQRRATKLVKSVTNLPYCAGLEMPGLTTFYYRRLRADVIQVYRIINRIDKLEISIFVHFNTRPSRYHSVSLIKPRALTSVRQKQVFSCRVVNSE